MKNTQPTDSVYPLSSEAYIQTGELQPLNKREYFAAIAMQGLLTRLPNRQNNETDLGVKESKRIAEEAVIMADELINALNK